MSAIAAPSPADLLSPVPSSFTVFIDSSIDTHFAILVHHEDTVDELKRKIKDAHAACFPNIGEIFVDAIKVKRGDFFYHMAASMVVESAFHGLQGTRFIYIDVKPASVSKHQAMIGENAGRTGTDLVIGSHTTQESAKCQIPNTSIMNDTTLLSSALNRGSPSPQIAKNRPEGLGGTVDDLPASTDKCVLISKCKTQQTLSLVNEHGISPSPQKNSITNEQKMQKQVCSDESDNHDAGLGANDQVNKSERVQYRGLASNANDIATSVITRKKRGRQDDQLTENELNHSYLPIKKHKKGNDELSIDPITQNCIETSVHANENKLTNLKNCMEKNTVLYKPDKQAFSEDLSSKLINDSPLRPQFSDKERRKGKKKRTSSKSVNERESPILPNTSDEPLHHHRLDTSLQDKNTNPEETPGRRRNQTEKSYAISTIDGDLNLSTNERNNEEDADNGLTNANLHEIPSEVVGSESFLNTAARKLHKHRQKNACTSEFSNNLSKNNLTLLNQENEENTDPLMENRLANSNKASHGASIIKEVTAVEDISCGSEVLPDLGVVKSQRKKRKSTKIELLNSETREEAPAKDLIREHGSILADVMVEPEPSFREEAASLVTSSNTDPIKDSNVIIEDLIHSTDTTVAYDASDATDLSKNGLKKSHKGKKRTGRVEALGCDYTKSDVVVSLIKEKPARDHGKSLGNPNDLRKRPEQAVFPDKSSIAETLTEADEVAPSESQITPETNAMCNTEVADHNRNSDVILSESTFHVESTALGNKINDNYVASSKKKLHSKRKKLAKPISNHELLKSDLPGRLGNPSFERSIGDVRINNHELENESKSTMFSGGAVDIKHNLEMNSAFHLSSGKADTPAVEVKSGECNEDCQSGQGKRTENSLDLVEASVPKNCALANPNEVPGLAKKKSRQGRKKEMTEGSKAFSVNNVIENGKKPKVATTLGENDIANVAEISKLSADISGIIQSQQKETGVKTDAFMASELIRTPGSHVAEGIINVVSSNNPKTLSSHPPIEKKLSEYNVLDVEHNDNDGGQNAAPTNSDVECTQLPESPEAINFLEFFVPSVTQSTSREEFISKKASKILRPEKNKESNRKLEKDVPDAAQDLMKPSSLVKGHKEKKITCNIESVGQVLDGSAEAFPCHKENNVNSANGETKMIPLDHQSHQNQKSNSVKKQMNLVDPSDNGTQADTKDYSKRYRIAVRKAPGSKSTGFHDNSIQKKTMVSPTIFDGAISGSSDDEYEKRSIMESEESTLNSSTSSDSEEEDDEVQRTSTGSKSAVNQNKSERSSLCAILKGTRSYKKANKLKASQAQSDSESQPDVVLESQLESV